MAKTKASMLGMNKRRNKFKPKPKPKAEQKKLMSILYKPEDDGLNQNLPHRMFSRSKVSFNEK